METLLQELHRIADTGDPYFQNAIQKAETIKIRSISRNGWLRCMLDEINLEFNVKERQCYDNCIRIAYKYQKAGVTYVEGYVKVDGLIYSHAWIGFLGGYYDPTFTVLAKKSRDEKDSYKSAEYVKFSEMTFSDIYKPDILGFESDKYLPPTPVNVYHFGCNDDQQEVYAAMGWNIDMFLRIVSIFNKRSA